MPSDQSSRDRGSLDRGLAQVERHLAAGERPLALAALLPLLQRRQDEGDRVAGAALLLLTGSEGVPPDALAAAVERLIALVTQQDAQIRTLLDLLEATL